MPHCWRIVHSKSLPGRTAHVHTLLILASWDLSGCSVLGRLICTLIAVHVLPWGLWVLTEKPMLKPLSLGFSCLLLSFNKQTNLMIFFFFGKTWFISVSGKKEEIWIIDDFIIDGNNLNNPVMLLDTFDFGPREDNWFFYPGGNIGLYCPYSSKGAP